MHEDAAAPRFGPCCNCGRTDGVRNITMLSRRGPTPGRGWGCVQCGLPLDGAIAVVCDDCTTIEPKFVCSGYPVTLGRVPIKELSPDVFDHDMTKHPECYHDFAD